MQRFTDNQALNTTILKLKALLDFDMHFMLTPHAITHELTQLRSDTLYNEKDAKAWLLLLQSLSGINNLFSLNVLLLNLFFTVYHHHRHLNHHQIHHVKQNQIECWK